MVMEYIEGPTLKAELKERSIKGQIFNLPETTRIFSGLASAIDYAHSRGMVHRDLKPANIMFTREGQVVLTDFGIARIMGATQYTMTGAISGTPAYMSPEQGQGERGDERSDIYSLGVILYEMVLGSVPFDADTPFAIIMKHINDPLPMPRVINPDLPEGLERVILKALSKNPDDRYQTASEMAQALREAAGVSAEQTLAAMPIATIAPTPRVEEVPVGPGIGVLSAPGSAQAATADPRKIAGLPFLPVVLGVGAVAFVCIVALAVVIIRLATTGQLAQRPQQESINATQTAVAVAVSTQEADTPTPLPTLTDYPTYTPPPSPTERVVVVTPTPLPAADTPTSPPLATDTPPPPPTYIPLPTYTLQPTRGRWGRRQRVAIYR
jgi:serine/threonine-protein kinase